ncbi:MAG TPA: PIN domain nuclease [Steroidobacteraceae bacterium]|nr:PIN domain nuclease [Steroidobacteraceae bacterium]
MVLIDTSVWVDFFNGVSSAETDELDRLLGTGRILIGDLILAEILQGFARDTDYRRARSLLMELPYADLGGREIALAAADNYRRLRRRGFTVRKTIDVIIGTFCMVNDHELLHCDRDFDCMEQGLGLRISRQTR